MKIEWCRRDLIRSAYYGLCLDEDAFKKELKRLNVPVQDQAAFTHGDKHACTHFFVSGTERTVIVTMKGYKNLHPVEVYGLLVHEAVHIWQWEIEKMREEKPGDEIEAYAIQSVSQNLIAAYFELTKRRDKRRK